MLIEMIKAWGNDALMGERGCEGETKKQNREISPEAGFLDEANPPKRGPLGTIAETKKWQKQRHMLQETVYL